MWFWHMASRSDKMLKIESYIINFLLLKLCNFAGSYVPIQETISIFIMSVWRRFTIAAEEHIPRHVYDRELEVTGTTP